MSRFRESSARIFSGILLAALVASSVYMPLAAGAAAADGTTRSKPVAVNVQRNFFASEIAFTLKGFEPDRSARAEYVPPPTWAVYDGAGNEIASGKFEYG